MSIATFLEIPAGVLTLLFCAGIVLTLTWFVPSGDYGLFRVPDTTVAPRRRALVAGIVSVVLGLAVSIPFLGNLKEPSGAQMAVTKLKLDPRLFEYPVGTANGVVWVNRSYFDAILSAMTSGGASGEAAIAQDWLRTAVDDAQEQDGNPQIVERTSSIVAAISVIEKLNDQ